MNNDSNCQLLNYIVYFKIIHEMDEIKNGRLTWYGRVQRMIETRIPKQVANWKPPGGRKRGSPRKRWREGTVKRMQKRNLRDDMWRDRQERRDVLHYEPIN